MLVSQLNRDFFILLQKRALLNTDYAIHVLPEDSRCGCDRLAGLLLTFFRGLSHDDHLGRPKELLVQEEALSLHCGDRALRKMSSTGGADCLVEVGVEWLMKRIDLFDAMSSQDSLQLAQNDLNSFVQRIQALLLCAEREFEVVHELEEGGERLRLCCVQPHFLLSGGAAPQVPLLGDGAQQPVFLLLALLPCLLCFFAELGYLPLERRDLIQKFLLEDAPMCW